MKKFIHEVFTKYHVFITMGVVCLVLLIIGFGEYRNFQLRSMLLAQGDNLASTTLAFTNLNTKVDKIVKENNLLNQVVKTEIAKNDIIAGQVQKVSDTALTLDKLSKVDPKLLQKYSKVYFLNENYTPEGLVSLPDQLTYGSKSGFKLIDVVKQHLEDMYKAAANDGIEFRVVSAYRSFGTQAALKSSYQVTYGAGTSNQFSADQGYSEHQLGTTVDFATTETSGDLDQFEKTDAYKWVKSNAHSFGFIMSYPKNNSYYVYEPWHWRYVGVVLADKLYNDGEFFYDLDQNTINNYLSLFFD